MPQPLQAVGVEPLALVGQADGLGEPGESFGLAGRAEALQPSPGHEADNGHRDGEAEPGEADVPSQQPDRGAEDQATAARDQQLPDRLRDQPFALRLVRRQGGRQHARIEVVEPLIEFDDRVGRGIRGLRRRGVQPLRLDG